MRYSDNTMYWILYLSISNPGSATPVILCVPMSSILFYQKVGCTWLGFTGAKSKYIMEAICNYILDL